MAVSTTQYKRCDVVEMDGRIDSATAGQLESAMKAVNEDGRYRIVFDMSDVDFVSSKGWWVLIETQKTCKRYNRGELVLAGMSDNIRTSLELVGMERYFKSFDTVTDAVGSF